MGAGALLIGVDGCGYGQCFAPGAGSRGIAPCSTNVIRIAGMLRDVYGYHADSIITMTNDNQHGSIPPTRINVELALMKMVAMARADDAVGAQCTLWVYGCFEDDLGEDGLFCIQGDPLDPWFTRDQFGTFLRMLPQQTRVVCLVDSVSSCSGMFDATGGALFYRYTGRRSQSCGLHANALGKAGGAAQSSLPDVLFFFTQLPSRAGALASDRRGTSEVSARKEGSARESEGSETEATEKSGAGGTDDAVDASSSLAHAHTKERRMTDVFMSVFKEYGNRMSCTTLLRKMSAMVRKDRLGFVPILETTRPLDAVRPFSATLEDLPIMLVSAPRARVGDI